VRQVITIRSPIIRGPKYTSLARIAQRGGADLGFGQSPEVFKVLAASLGRR
jgi:hypothetical protein